MCIQALNENTHILLSQIISTTRTRTNNDLASPSKQQRLRVKRKDQKKAPSMALLGFIIFIDRLVFVVVKDERN